MRNEALEFPKSICLETCSLCNGSCSFCPYSTIKQEVILMDKKTVLKMIDEISQHNIERFSLFNNNEPLLDQNIFEYIAYAKEKMPNVRQTISSNGKKLDSNIIEKFIKSGIDRVFISIPTLEPLYYEKLMGFNIDNILDAINNTKPEYYKYIRIAIPETKYYEKQKFDEFFGTKGIKCIPWKMEAKKNWVNYDSIRHIGNFDVQCGCDRPLDQAIISSNGDVLICCRDWYHENVLGNILDNSLEQVWNSATAKSIQSKIVNKDYNSIVCCSSCTRICEFM